MFEAKSPTGKVGKARPGGRAERVRIAVMSAVMAELFEVGFARLRVESVAKRAGVHKTTVYRRWPSREALVADALRSEFDAAVPVPDTGNLRGDLLAVARDALDSHRSATNNGLLRLFASESGSSEHIAELARGYWRQRFAAARQIVERAVGRGELEPGTAVDRVLDVLVGPLYFRRFLMCDPVDESYLDAHVDRVIAATRMSPA